MKVLFLDIDGVLNSERTYAAYRGYPGDFSQSSLDKFDWVAVSLIKKLCEETGCVVVMSTSWRLEFDVKDFKYNFGLPVIDVTPSLHLSRGFEIQAWLDAHEEVTMYAIVDDYADMLDSQDYYFVRTSGEEGLSYRNYMDLKTLLSNEW